MMTLHMINPLMQMINAAPLTSMEARELLVRHVLASPGDESRQPVTQILRDLFMSLSVLDKKPLNMVSQENVWAMLREQMLLGFDHSGGQGFYDPWWPQVMPLVAYPKDILVELGAAFGLKAASTPNRP